MAKREVVAEKLPICLNPDCKKSFRPGHYGKLQKVGTGAEHIYKISCPPCHGSGKRRGDKCGKCSGSGQIRQSCAEWYRSYWAQIRKPPRGMSDQERMKALRAAEKEDLRFWSLLVAAACSALRKGELLGLTWADVEDGKEIRSNFPLRGQWDDKEGFKATKTGSGRIAYFLKEARVAVKRVRSTVAKDEVLTDRIWPYWESRVWTRWTGLQKRLGIVNPETGRPFRVHDLRHTSALRALDRTKDLRDVAELCGHKSIATSQIYTQRRPEVFVASLEKESS